MENSRFRIQDFDGSSPGFYSGTSLPSTGKSGEHFLLTTSNEVYEWNGSWTLVASLGGASYTDQDALDAVGNALQDTSTVNLTYSGNLISAAVASGSISSTELASGISATKIGDGSISNTEFQYLNNVSSNIQNQFSNKQPLSSDLTTLSSINSSYGFLKTTGTPGDWSIDLNTYLTGNQTITLSGQASGSGATSIAVTLDNSAVIGKVLTGYASASGTVAATDTILQAFNKLNGNIALKEPTITAGTSGQFWRGDKTWATVPWSALGNPSGNQALIMGAYRTTWNYSGTPTGNLFSLVGASSTAGIGHAMFAIENGTDSSIDLMKISNDGLTRFFIDFIGNVYIGSLTSGRVPYIGSSGLLQDSANLTFNGTTLTTSGVVANSFNKVRVTTPATSATLSIADGATLAVSGSTTLLNGTHSGTNTGDQTITLTGQATGSGTSSLAVTLDNAAVIGKVLTGFTNSGTGVISASDTILSAIQKLDSADRGIPTYKVLVDDFIAGSTTTAQIGELKWYIPNGTITRPTPVSGHPGCFTATTATPQYSSALVCLHGPGNVTGVDFADIERMTWIIKTGPDVTQGVWLFGCYGNSAYDSYFGNEALCFEHLAFGGTGYWKGTCRHGGSTTTVSSPGIVLADTWYQLEVRRVATTNWQFFVNGISIGTNSTNLPTGTAGFAANLQTYANPGARSYTLDYFSVVLRTSARY